jgi:Tfp pilus assembly protein FimT
VGFVLLVNRKAGFTLLDSLIVIVILGIIGMVIIPEFQGLIQETRLSEAAAEIVSGMQYAGNLAVRYRRPFGFQADATGTSHLFKIFDNRYYTNITVCTDQVQDDPRMNTDCVVLNPLDKDWYIRDFAAMENYREVTFAIKRDDVLIPFIVFYPDGHSASSDTAVTVGLGSRQKTIMVDGTTSRIRTQ